MKTLSEISVDHWLASPAAFGEAVAAAGAITLAYRAFGDAGPAEREAEVLASQFPAMFQPVKSGDAFAGRVYYPLAGLSPEPMGLGYYCAFEALQEGSARFPEHSHRARTVAEFWRGKTGRERCHAAYPKALAERLPSDDGARDSGVGFPLYRMAGTTLDYAKLLRLGLDGLHRELAGTPFAHVAPLLRATIDRYHAAGDDPVMRATLAAIRHQPPRTFRQAIQLIWLYALHAGTWNYGRLDDVLGPYLVADLQAGILSEGDALDLLCSLWRQMHAYANLYNNRVIIGGRGRSNEAAADRFALLAIEATRRERLNQPQLSLRFHGRQNPALWDRAIDAIAEGRTFPMLYNDDLNIPAVAAAFKVPEAIATHYTPYGCGEYVLGPYSEGTPNGVINLLKALEIALHGGADPLTGIRVLHGIPEPGAMEDFDAVWVAYAKVVETYVEALAEQQRITYTVAAAQAPFAFISALTADCVERGKGAFGGGVRYLGGTLETYGNNNTADSLHVIDTLAFRDKTCTLPELVAALDANFEGHEQLLQACRGIRKYGNDEGTADAMAIRVHQHVCGHTAAQAPRVGLDSYLVVIINNWANTIFGKNTSASAEGRLAGQPLANGNNPAPGADISGVTAFLNSLTRLDPALHAGAVQNMKFGREWFSPAMRPKFEALLRTYFAKGGAQAMITVVSRDDLQAAMREPEKWGHLMVRVGGFSIRFIELPPDAQREVLARTLH
jgi:pyruvate-formate lyase